MNFINNLDSENSVNCNVMYFSSDMLQVQLALLNLIAVLPRKLNLELSMSE
jgi:hypothetical protein